jgi:L-threonylcarbamoyladenylate synthase
MTECYRIDPEHPDPAVIARAAAVLRAGGLVAFPTETVYGLGANALDAGAVAGIFAAKGRSPTNPVIVHVNTAQAIEQVAIVSDLATRLAEVFWPGPLTLVLPKLPVVPGIVTAGGSTVGVRAPAHPVAQALIAAAGVPIAAPSANRSLQLSPTRAEHVQMALGDRVQMILDGGPAGGGLESTVIDLTTQPPRLLRPGLVTPDAIEAAIGPIIRTPGTPLTEAGPLPSPGMLSRHYAPQAILEIALDGGARVAQLALSGRRVGWLTFTTPTPIANVVTITMPREPRVYASRLFAELHGLDAAGVETIVVDWPPDGDAWLAIRDRLNRAAAPR